jgi:hypothetical protein
MRLGHGTAFIMCCQESTIREFRGKILSFCDRTQHMDARHIRPGMFYKTYPTLPQQVNERGASKYYLVSAYGGDFRYACSRIVERQKQCMITTSSPTVSIGSGKQSVDLFARERLDESPISPFYGDSQYSCCQANQFRIAQSQPPKEGSDCGKTDVARSDAVMSIHLQTIEKGQDHSGVQRSNGE